MSAARPRLAAGRAAWRWAVRFPDEPRGERLGRRTSTASPRAPRPGRPRPPLVCFLLAREPRESILGRFDLPLIGRYFPEYEREISAVGRPHPSDADRRRALEAAAATTAGCVSALASPGDGCDIAFRSATDSALARLHGTVPSQRADPTGARPPGRGRAPAEPGPPGNEP